MVFFSQKFWTASELTLIERKQTGGLHTMTTLPEANSSPLKIDGIEDEFPYDLFSGAFAVILHYTGSVYRVCEPTRRYPKTPGNLRFRFFMILLMAEILHHGMLKKTLQIMG